MQDIEVLVLVTFDDDILKIFRMYFEKLVDTFSGAPFGTNRRIKTTFVEI